MYACVVHVSVLLCCVSTNIHLMMEDFSMANGNILVYIRLSFYIKNERNKMKESERGKEKKREKSGKVIETVGKNHKNRL